jgi:hypothetical protein
VDTTSGPGLRKNVPWQSREMIFRPYGAWSFGAWIPRLTPRASFSCPFAAETTRNAIAASRLGYGQSRLGLCRSVAWKSDFDPVVHIEQLASDDTHRKLTRAFLQSIIVRI